MKRLVLDEGQTIEINGVVLNAEVLEQLFVIQNSIADNEILSCLNTLMNCIDENFELVEQTKCLMVTSKSLQKLIDFTFLDNTIHKIR